MYLKFFNVTPSFSFLPYFKPLPSFFNFTLINSFLIDLLAFVLGGSPIFFTLNTCKHCFQLIDCVLEQL